MKKVSRISALFVSVFLFVAAVMPTASASALQLLPPLLPPIPQEPWYTNYPNQYETLVLAHQAGEGEYPSNSELGFTKAYEAGADVLDTDLFATADGQLVLFHDETLEHRTNGSGRVDSKTLAELQQLDFAYHWTPDGGATYPYRGQGITVMTAQRLFDLFPDIRFGIEIKQTTQQAAQDLCTMIKNYGAEDRVLVSSATQPNMNAFRTACPDVATSATQDEVIGWYIQYTLGISSIAIPKFSSLQVPETFSGITILTPDFVAAAHARGIRVYAWTIDTPEQAQHFMDMGVDGVNTSYPKRIVDWLTQ